MVALTALASFQFLLAIYMAVTMRIASKERALLNREMFGMVKKLEGLTAHRREIVLRHYDRILEVLSQRLPPAIAEQTSRMIFETESRILTRLAELEPSLREDEDGREKMDALIQTMESLEQTIVSLTADTVTKVMVEGRKNFLEDDAFSDVATSA